MNLKHLTDTALLLDTKILVAHEREISLKVLHHLKEIERRRLFSDKGYSSLFDYAVRELGYSEPSAARRISAARLLKEMPEIEKRIESGVLSLTNLSMASQLFRNEDIKDVSAKKEILKQIEGTTKAECEKVLKMMIPPTDIPSPFKIVKWNLSEETVKIWDEWKNRNGHRRVSQDVLIREALNLALKDYLKKRNADITTPVAEPCGTRKMTASLKRYIFTRDKGKCVKCGSVHKLEFDHVRPFSLGGETKRENLRLLCFSCNQRSRIQARL